MKITPILTPDGTTAHFRATSHAVRKLQAACRSDIDVGACAVEEESWAVCGRETIDTTASTLAAIVNGRLSSSDLLASAIEQGLSSPPRALTPKPLCTPATGGGAPSLSQMVVLTSATPPYAIMWASPSWLDVCGFSMAEIMGNNLSCIQGPGTDGVAIASLMQFVKRRQGCTIRGLINYDKKKRPFKHTLTVYPVKSGAKSARAERALDAASATSADAMDDSDGEVSHFRAESTDVSLSCGGVFGPAGMEPAGMTNGEEEVEEESQVWGCEFEDFLFTMGSFAAHVENRAARRRP